MNVFHKLIQYFEFEKMCLKDNRCSMDSKFSGISKEVIMTVKTIDNKIMELPSLPGDGSLVEVPGDFSEIREDVYRWSNPKLAYLASADQWLGFEAFFKKNDLMQCDVFYCTIGGLGGMNLLACLNHVKKIFFYDVNAYAALVFDMQIQLIKHCSSVNEYISLTYQRPFDCARYDFGNQKQFLQLPVEEKYAQELEKILTPQAYNTYNYYYLPYIMHLPLPLYDGPSTHCTHLVPFFESDDLKAPLVSGPLSNTNININTFYVGKGWLSNDKAFLAVRDRLLNSEVEVLIGDIGQIKPEGEFPGIYITNIYNTGKNNGYKKFAYMFRWVIGYDDNTDFGVKYYPRHNNPDVMVEYDRRIGAGNGNPHATCCQAIDNLLDLHGNQFLEVIEPHPKEGMNYGFRFYKGQKRISVEDYLKTDINNEEIIAVHILLGGGTSQELWRDVCRKAVRESKRFVMIFEHSKECTDWPQWDVHYDNLLSHEKLDQFIYSLDYRWKKYGMANVKGDVNDIRNILYFLEKDQNSDIELRFSTRDMISNSDFVPATQQINERIFESGRSGDLKAENNTLALRLFEQGMSELYSGNSKRSLSFFNQAVMACPDMPEVYFAWATAFAQIGDLHSARKACREELNRQPEHDGARKLLERIEKAGNVSTAD